MADTWDGRPEHPERDGWHWVCAAVGIAAPYPMLWSHDGKAWDTGDGWEFCTAPRMTERTRYLGPALLPAEVAALVEQARREGAEAMREACEQAACDAADPPGIKNEVEGQVAADAREMVMDAIRALPLPDSPNH